MTEKEQKKGKIIVKIVIVLVLLFMLVGLAVGKKYFKINKITITGNEYYTEEEIKEKVCSGYGTGNSLFLYLKYLMIYQDPFCKLLEYILFQLQEYSYL